MKKTLVVVIALVMGLAGAAFSADGYQEAFYRQCLVNRLYKCRSKTTLSRSSSEKLRKQALEAEMEANFYRSNAAQLVARMIEIQLAPNSSCVEHFLIKAYHYSVMTASSVGR